MAGVESNPGPHQAYECRYCTYTSAEPHTVDISGANDASTGQSILDSSILSESKQMHSESNIKNLTYVLYTRAHML